MNQLASPATLSPAQVNLLAQPKNAWARRDMRRKAHAAQREAWETAAWETGLAAVEAKIKQQFGNHILQLRNDAQQASGALEVARQVLIRAEESPDDEQALGAAQARFMKVEARYLRASDRLTRAEALIGDLEEKTHRARDVILERAPVVRFYAQVRAAVAARQKATALEFEGRWTSMPAGEFFAALAAADVGEHRTELRARATAHYDNVRVQGTRRRQAQRLAKEMRRGKGPYASEVPSGARVVAAAGLVLATETKESGRALARWLVSPEGVPWKLPQVTAADSLAALVLKRHAAEVPPGTTRMSATPDKAEVLATGRRGQVLARWRVSTPGVGTQFYLTDWTPPRRAKVQHYRAPQQRATVSLQGRRVLELGYQPNLLRRR